MDDREEHLNVEHARAAQPSAAQSGAEQPSVEQPSAAQPSAAHIEHTVTSDHDVIRRWAEDRHAVPATVEGTEDAGRVGELRLDFDFGNDLEELRQVSWDDWFTAFDERGLEFVFAHAPRPDGSASNEFHLEPAHGSGH
jgi:hypothetical protein